MVLTGKMQAMLIELDLILNKRLLYSENWKAVKKKVRSRYLEIKWFNPKNRDVSFKTIKIAPFNETILKEEIKRQKAKLKRDKKNVGL